jgi:hypothetical protein
MVALRVTCTPGKDVLELETILSAKTLATTQAEEINVMRGLAKKAMTFQKAWGLPKAQRP